MQAKMQMRSGAWITRRRFWKDVAAVAAVGNELSLGHVARSDDDRIQVTVRTNDFLRARSVLDGQPLTIGAVPKRAIGG
jgi:hypothetical protein